MKPAPSVAAVLLAAGGGTRFAGSTHKLLAPLDLAAGHGTSEAGTEPVAGSTPAAATPAPRVVDHALAAVLAAGFEQVVVVTGAVAAVDLWPAISATQTTPSPQQPPGITVLHNERWAEGLATSLQTAVAWATEQDLEAIVVGLADQPFIQTQAWQAVAAAVAPASPTPPDTTLNNPTHQIAVATYPDKSGPDKSGPDKSGPDKSGKRTPGNPVGIKRSVWHLLPTVGDEGARQLIRSRNDLCLPVACQGSPSDIDTVEDLQKWT